MADPTGPSSPYLVLARKYRPRSFKDLIGQQPMVQTLENAFKSGRIHHAFILTGVRGVGKTTTARILARAFNYEDETGRHPTLDLDKEGIHCRAIIEGNHVDVLEMDAASNTGIDSIREVNQMTRTPPMSAAYKVFIIDEVHMLSASAFNGLLKTLEEPPPYVKFIFATTEIRKVPVTILSRCQRFDLRRVAPEVMTAHLTDLLARETIEAESEAISMIVRAGEGSVRDNQSLLDQAIAHGDGKVTAATVKAMLGLGDRARIIDLFEALMTGDAAAALGMLRELYDAGADPQTTIGDLCDFTHLVTRIKIVPSAADDVSLTPDERSRGAALAQKIGMRSLTRAWQILFKGFEEVSKAGNAMQAAEMVLVRLVHAADLPTPDELISKLQNGTGAGSSPVPVATSPVRRPLPSGNGGAAVRAEAPQFEAAPLSAPLPSPETYMELVTLAGEKRDLLVKHALEANLRPISFAPGRIEVALAEGADPAIIQTLSARLRTWTGKNWLVTVSATQPTAPVAPTLRELADAKKQEELAEANDDPLVKAILDMFPGSKVTVTTRQPQVPVEAYADAIRDEDDEDSDP